MAGSTPNPLNEYNSWLSVSLKRYEALARSMVQHRGEKGRVVEGVVKAALRSLLPGRFGLGTGFAVTASGKMSPQLDLVIYDHWHNAPVLLEGGTGLFPIECVYGFVEVKSSLDKAAISQAMKAISVVRKLAAEKWYSAYERVEVKGGKPGVQKVERPNKLAPRSFLFAVNSNWTKLSTALGHVRESATKHNAHIHALTVLERDWFLRQQAYVKPIKFERKEYDAFATFCVQVLDSVQSMPMGPAAMNRYYNLGL